MSTRTGLLLLIGLLVTGLFALAVRNSGHRATEPSTATDDTVVKGVPEARGRGPSEGSDIPDSTGRQGHRPPEVATRAFSERPPRDDDGRWTRLRAALVAAISAQQRRRVDGLIDQIAHFAVEEDRIAFLEGRLSSSRESHREVCEALHFALVRTGSPGRRTWARRRFEDPDVPPRQRIAALVAGLHVAGPTRTPLIFEYPWLDARIPLPLGEDLHRQLLEVVAAIDRSSFPRAQDREDFLKALVPLLAELLRDRPQRAEAWVALLLDPEKGMPPFPLFAAFRASPRAPDLLAMSLETGRSPLLRAAALQSLPDLEDFAPWRDMVQQTFQRDPDPNLRLMALDLLIKGGGLPESRLVALVQDAPDPLTSIYALRGLIARGGPWATEGYRHAFSKRASPRLRKQAFKLFGTLATAPLRPEPETVERLLADRTGRECDAVAQGALLRAIPRFKWHHLRPVLERLLTAPETTPTRRRALEEILAALATP